MPDAKNRLHHAAVLLHHRHYHRNHPRPRPSPHSSLVDAIVAATKRAHAGTLSAGHAHDPFDGLLRFRQATPVPERSLSGFLAALARAPASDACGDGPELAIALFKRISKPAGRRQVAAFTDRTYSILVECCCRARRPDLARACFGRFLRTGLGSDKAVANTLRRCLPVSAFPSTSPPSAVWSPTAAFSAAAERVRAGNLSAEDAHSLFDGLLRQADPVPVRFLNAFLAALARAPAGREGPALAVALFNRVCREEGGLQVAPLSVQTYSVLMDCCCRARRPELGLAVFGRLLRMGLKANQITANTFLKCLCYAERTDDAVDTLLHRMSDLGCAPDAFSYSFVLKGLCDVGRSQKALDVLQMVVKEGGACPLDVVVYNTVIHGLCNEGEVGKAFNLFHDEMMQRGVVPDAVTYSMIIQGLLKEGEVSKAEVVIRQMVDQGVQPDKVAYYSIIQGYSSLGRVKEAGKMFGEMKTRGLQPNTVTSTR